MDNLLFFCDIQGTITGGTNYYELIEKLNQLKKVYLCDKIVFSFVSSDNMGTIKHYVSELQKYDNDLIFGKQFYSDGYIDYQTGIVENGEKYNSKLGSMIEYTKEISEKENLKLICLADDNASNMYFDVLHRLNSNVEIKLLCPSNEKENIQIISTNTYGIEGLYECLDILVKTKTRKR